MAAIRSTRASMAAERGPVHTKRPSLERMRPVSRTVGVDTASSTMSRTCTAGQADYVSGMAIDSAS
jgi:hypothetical protein